MGDMKTPDFDDLLAAFDIPDIDAKEAIQSSPEEEKDGLGTNVNQRHSGSPTCFPAAPHCDAPLVSVIVKNTVRSESFEEEEKSVRDTVDNPSSSVSVSQGHDFTSKRSPKLCLDAASELLVANGFEGPAVHDQQQSSIESWSMSSPLRSQQMEKGGENDKEKESGSVHHTTDIINSLRPLLYPESSAAGPSSSPPPPSPPSVSTHNSPRTPTNIEAPFHSEPLSSPSKQNENTAVAKKRLVLTEDEDSEPDLGSPLVIQESPESIMSSPPDLKRRAKSHTVLVGSPEASSSRVSPSNLSYSIPQTIPKTHFEDNLQPTTSSSPPSPPQLQRPQEGLSSISTSSAPVQEEKYPEHVIDERDSPESPPPSEMGLIVMKRSSSPDPGSTPNPVLNHKEVCQLEELMETEPTNEDEPGDTKEPEEKVAGDEESKKEANCVANTDNTMSASVGEEVSNQLGPLRVKIKVPKGSKTRDAPSVGRKRVGRPTTKSVDVSKRSPRGRKPGSKKASQLPAAALPQEACADTLQRARAVKGKTSVNSKVKVSPTAVSITKTTALPSISSSRVGAGALNLRSLGQKTLNSGVALPGALPLLPPQTGSRPASIVNSTGAIISKSQTTLVESFNKILNNKNLLPSYKPDLSTPPPAEWGISLPAQGYRCLECGDSFALERSLAQHYDRRSLRIEVTCNHCAKRLVFFNKCGLLLHAREHKEKGLIMQCSHLVMKPVPVAQMISQQEPAAAATSLSSQAMPKPTSTGHKVVQNKKSEPVQYTNYKCPECQVQFATKEEVADHFQEIKPAHSNSCTECSPHMLLPNNCSAAAHQRFHLGQPPHVCPECGGVAKQSGLQTHLQEACLHFARRIGYRCSSCLVVFGGLNSVKSHIQQAHCDMFHKCPSCPMAFKSAPSIQSHITAQHPTLTEGQPMLIYKCVMCDTVFTHKPLLYIHFDTHLTNQKVHVFKCPECTKLFSQRNSLLDHVKTHKTPELEEDLPLPPVALDSSQSSVKVEENSDEDWTGEESEEKTKTKRAKPPTGWTCSLCHTRHRVREDYITHMREKHGKILKKFPCNKCASSFSNSSNMMRHMKDKHTAFNRGICCPFCAEDEKTFSSEAMLEKHILLRHNQDSVNQDTVTPLGGKDEADSSSEQDSSSGTCRRRRRKAVKMEQDEESREMINPAKKLHSSSLPESGFRCAPCGFTSEDKAAFVEHISQHSRGGDGASLQCLQCGVCFTSASSLSRHRFITHKVRNATSDNLPAPTAQSALSPNNGRSQEDRSSVNGSAPASPFSQGREEEGSLACKVCGKHFEKVTDLNTHFRTHGMAFINARNAVKST